MDCCLYDCIYVSVTKPTYPAFNAWLNTGAIRSLKMTGKAICSVVTALPSKLCAALHGQSNVGSMCDCKPCRVWTYQFKGCLRFVIVVFPDHTHLLFLVEILSGVDSDHSTGPRRNGSVKSRSTLCPIERRSC